MRVLLTGSSGKVGSIVAQVLREQHAVLGVDAAAHAQTSVVADIRDYATMADCLRDKDIDAVVHLAALHAPHRDAGFSDADFIAINVEATAHLLDAARAAGVKRFILASTTSVYGDALQDDARAVWVTETLKPQPRDIYDETKLAAEALCADACGDGFVTAAIRMSRCFDEPMREMALYRLYRGVGAVDVAQAFALSLTAELKQFEAFNISAATPFTQNDCELLKVDAPKVLAARIPGIEHAFAARGWLLPQSIDRVYVCKKARTILGYQSRENFREFMDAVSK